jgi:peptide-methionine (S)-S-oxide reductase
MGQPTKSGEWKMVTSKVRFGRFAAGALIALVALGLYARVGRLPTASADSVQRIPISAPAPGRDVAVLAGGCFWAMQAMFEQLKGVDEVVPGFAGGHTPSPSYEEVCNGDTGYAESIRIVYDPSVISYHDLLTIFFTAHDPTTLNQQGDDVGTNYRSAIFYRGADQKAAAERAMAEAQKALGDTPIVTQVVPYTNFYPAELYHNNYFAQHPDEPYCATVVAPKVEKFREHWRQLLKS